MRTQHCRVSRLKSAPAPGGSCLMPARSMESRCAPLALVLLIASCVSAQAQSLLVTPAEVKLEGNFARVQLVVTAADLSGMVNERSEDLTTQAKFVSSDANIVSAN